MQARPTLSRSLQLISPTYLSPRFENPTPAHFGIAILGDARFWRGLVSLVVSGNRLLFYRMMRLPLLSTVLEKASIEFSPLYWVRPFTGDRVLPHLLSPQPRTSPRASIPFVSEGLSFANPLNSRSGLLNRIMPPSSLLLVFSLIWGNEPGSPQLSRCP